MPLVALLELAGHYHFAAAAPPPPRWASLKEPVERLHRPGDLLIVSPYWAEPNARAVFGDGLMPLADVARPDETAYPRIIELSILGQDTDVPGLRLESEEQHGPFRLRVFSNSRYRKQLVDFADWLGNDATSVSSVRGKQETPCTWNPSSRVSTGAPALHGHPTFPKARYQCSKNEFHFVGVTVIEDQRYRPHRCIWAHPAERESTVIRFSAVPLGQVIRGFGGLSWFLERESKGTDIKLEVRVDHEPLGVYQHADGDGWTGFEFDTAAFAGTPHQVEFRVSSSRARQREFCFHASVH